jgi:hypothetical protein
MAASAGSAAVAGEVSRWNLAKETELRFEVADAAPACVKVSGQQGGGAEAQGEKEIVRAGVGVAHLIGHRV